VGVCGCHETEAHGCVHVKQFLLYETVSRENKGWKYVDVSVKKKTSFFNANDCKYIYGSSERKQNLL